MLCSIVSRLSSTTCFGAGLARIICAVVALTGWRIAIPLTSFAAPQDRAGSGSNDPAPAGFTPFAGLSSGIAPQRAGRARPSGLALGFPVQQLVETGTVHRQPGWLARKDAFDERGTLPVPRRHQSAADERRLPFLGARPSRRLTPLLTDLCNRGENPIPLARQPVAVEMLCQLGGVKSGIVT